MSDFATKSTKPTASEYLAASDDELLERLNKNPNNLDSEFPFIQSIIAVRTAKSQRETNEGLVRQTRWLAIATWVLCIITILTSAYSVMCR